MSAINNFVAKTRNFTQQMRSLTTDKFTSKICKSLFVSTLFLCIIYLFLSSSGHPCCQSPRLFGFSKQKWSFQANNNSPTNMAHVMFGIAGSSNTWKNRRRYIESWWQPNKTRGFIFLDRTPIEYLPWPPSCPPFRVSEDTSKYREYNKHRWPFALRMVHVIAEMFKEDTKGVRWFVMADDDTIFFMNNLLDVLSKCDHGKYFYIGTNSEATVSNLQYAFSMAFGGAGIILSYPLAEAVGNNIDTCIQRYPTLMGSDHMLQGCIEDLGISLTKEEGLHQIDIRGDISGLLSAHPQSLLLSLHHLDYVNPIFPSMNRYESVNHIMKAAKVDESRLLQQSVCYHKQSNWTLSISWGYSSHIYETILPPSFLVRPLETFTKWRNGATPNYLLNTRLPSNNDTCETPHVFFFDSVDQERVNHVVTTYTRRSPRGLPACLPSGNHSAEHISKIHVLSPMRKHEVGAGSRRECCDVVQLVGKNSMAVKLRSCMNDEIVG